MDDGEFCAQVRALLDERPRGVVADSRILELHTDYPLARPIDIAGMLSREYWRRA